jgi:hypothetical protein
MKRDEFTSTIRVEQYRQQLRVSAHPQSSAITKSSLKGYVSKPLFLDNTKEAAKGSSELSWLRFQ